MKLNILVTGCGGDIGQSVGKILNNSINIDYLIGCDISNQNAGKFIYNNFILGIPCSHKNYLKSIESIINKKDIDLVLPISEPELRFLSKTNTLNRIGTAKIIAANAKSLEIGFDKLKTANFLKKNNFPFPKTVQIIDIKEPLSYPVIIKSKTGSGSSTVYVVKNKIDFDYLKQKHPDFIVQEYLSFEDGEFTCGVFRSSQGEIRSIILKRKLTGGYSDYGEVIHNERITILLEMIAKKLDLIGSINIQLRLVSKKPVIFEINPRFSSTVLFRHMFGFEDLIWSIQDKIGQEILPFKEVEEGKKFYKGFSEYIDQQTRK